MTDPPYKIENTNAGGKSEFAKSIQGMNDELESEELNVDIDIKILPEFVKNLIFIFGVIVSKYLHILIFSLPKMNVLLIS